MRAFLTARWAPLTAVIATVAYAVTVIGFGLNYRPLHNDEGVTLSVASRPSARDVLDVAIDDRHGPPLHYLAVHASLVLRDDMLGLRLPSALFGILAIALAYGFGRELLGRSGGAVLAVLVATIPEVVHLAQFARGYTAMLAASFGSMWLLLLLVRTRRARYVAPYAVSALLLVAAHPFGLFALASEMVLLVVLGLAPLRHGWRSQRRNLIVLSLALGTGLLAMLLLWRVYSQLQPKYGVGQGGAVVDLGSSEFWRRIGDAWTGSSYVIVWVALAAAALAGLVMLAMRDRRAALILGVWLVQPVVLLSILTATSPDFAPERHLSFMIPAYVRRAGHLPGRGGAPGRSLRAVAGGAADAGRDHAGCDRAQPRRRQLHPRPAARQPLPGQPVRQRRRAALDRRRAGAGRRCPALRRLRGPGCVRHRLAVAVARRRPGHGLRPGRAARRPADSGRGLGAPALVQTRPSWRRACG